MLSPLDTRGSQRKASTGQFLVDAVDVGHFEEGAILRRVAAILDQAYAYVVPFEKG
jgi:hypothetical protein